MPIFERYLSEILVQMERSIFKLFVKGRIATVDRHNLTLEFIFSLKKQWKTTNSYDKHLTLYAVDNQHMIHKINGT